ncbi:ketopantoate reductase C-terminal domain-containing protein, partial [Halorubrum pallidum]
TEVDAIYGAVTDRAAQFDAAAPTCRTLSSLLRAWEREEGLRGEHA